MQEEELLEVPRLRRSPLLSQNQWFARARALLAGRRERVLTRALTIGVIEEAIRRMVQGRLLG
jgi:hypothetical protein